MTQPPFEGNHPSGTPEESGNHPSYDEQRLVIASLEEQLALAREQLAQAEEVATAAGEHIEYLETHGQIDPLMGIANRARLAQYYQNALKRNLNRRHGETEHPEELSDSVIMMDVDHFKRINDGLGHAYGDTVLRTLANIIRENVRDQDIPTRYGGEEIAIILPDTDPEEAWYVAERLRTAVQDTPMGEQEIQVTASFGVGPLLRGADESVGVSGADQALYVAKETGRNRIMMYGDITPGQ